MGRRMLLRWVGRFVGLVVGHILQRRSWQGSPTYGQSIGWILICGPLYSILQEGSTQFIKFVDLQEDRQTF